MARYEDEATTLDEEGLTITSYRWPGDAKRIAYSSIRAFEVFEMGLWSGRLRLVGISFGRPRTWFPWGRSKTNRSTAISLDVGKWVRPTIVPDDPDTVELVLRETIAGK